MAALCHPTPKELGQCSHRMGKPSSLVENVEKRGKRHLATPYMLNLHAQTLTIRYVHRKGKQPKPHLAFETDHPVIGEPRQRRD